MQLEKVFNWLPKSLFQIENGGQNPISAKIVDYKQSKGAKGTDHTLHLDVNGKLYQLSIFGDSLNTLIDAYGGETDAWKGKLIQIMLLNRNGKEVRVIKPVTQQ